MPEVQDPSERPIQVGLLLIDGFALMSYAAFIEPLRAANNLAGHELYAWRHYSIDGGEVRASNGVGLLADGQVGAPVDLDLLMVFAAGYPAEFRNTQCMGWLRKIARQGTIVGGVSGGPYLLARAGLLSGYRATIHWEHAAAFRDEFPDLELESNLFIIDRRRITCAGGTAALDLAIKLIEDAHGPELAQSVGEWFIRAEPRESSRDQRPNLADRYGTRDVRLLSALEAMEGSIETPLPRAELAAIAGCSLRHLERLCHTHLGKGTSEIYMEIRLRHAAQLLRSTDLSVTEVSVISGFRTPGHFSRRFSQQFGIMPSHLAQRHR